MCLIIEEMFPIKWEDTAMATIREMRCVMKGKRTALFVVFTAAVMLVSTDVFCKTTEINLGDKSPSQKKEQLIWNVNVKWKDS